MTLTVLERDRTHIGRPRLAPAIGQARLTAGVRNDMLTASWDDHVGVYGEPHTWSRAAQVMSFLQSHSVLGRGGAGFPLVIKMDAVIKAKGRPVVVVNAAEGEPAIWKDRTLLALVPHLVLDGAQLAALAVGADRIHVAVNPSHRPAHLALLRAIDERQLRTRDAVPVTVHVVPDEFTAGECSSVVGLINGGRGRPQFVSTIAAVRGVDGRPTLLSNTETFAQLAVLARMGDRYAEVGTPAEPGTALFTLRGAVHDDVVVEAPLGTPLGAVVNGAGGLSEPIQAVLVGGYHGRWLAPDVAWNAPLSVAEMRARGGAIGAGLIAPLAASACPLSEVSRVVSYLAGQTAGQCGPCVNGLPAIADAVDGLVAGDREGRARKWLTHWLGLMEGRGACKHPDGVARFVGSSLRVFDQEITLHRHRGPCPSVGAPILPTPPTGGWR